MDILKKNDFIVKHSGVKHFERDLELFQKHCPNSTLHRDLRRVNTFNKVTLSKQILYELLDKVTPDVIFDNRKPADAAEPPPPPPPKAQQKTVQKHPQSEPSKKKPSTKSSPA